jgi:AraC-like DNA-binding protein
MGLEAKIMSLDWGEHWASQKIADRKQFEAFQEELDRTHFHWSLFRDEGNGGFYGEVLRRRIEDFVLTDVIADPVKGERTSREITQDQNGYYCLLYLESGYDQLAQGRNECLLKPGYISLWDSTRSASFAVCERARQVSILIPHSMAQVMIPSIDDLCGLAVDGNQGLGAVLLSHLRQVHKTIHTIAPVDRPAIMRATLELTGAAFRPNGQKAKGTAFRQAVLRRVQEYILQNLRNPELSPSSIAAAFKFSPRYLHRMFEEYDYSVSDWIRHRRLLAARSDLSATTDHSLSITQIAMRYGFSDGAHFSRSFKQAFGLSPRDYRKSLTEKASF